MANTVGLSKAWPWCFMCMTPWPWCFFVLANHGHNACCYQIMHMLLSCFSISCPCRVLSDRYALYQIMLLALCYLSHNGHNAYLLHQTMPVMLWCLKYVGNHASLVFRNSSPWCFGVDGIMDNMTNVPSSTHPRDDLMFMRSRPSCLVWFHLPITMLRWCWWDRGHQVWFVFIRSWI